MSNVAALSRPAVSRKPRRILRKLALAGLVAMILAELLLRFALGLGTPVLSQNDPDCGYLPASSQHVRRFFRLNEINAHGMRSPEIKTPKPPGEFRVLFVGDSVTYGTTYVDQKRIFTSILEKDLPATLHRPVEVLNASAGGWAVGNELGYIRSRGLFNSDLVVFVLNTDDLIQPFSPGVAGSSPAVPDRNPPLALAEAWTRYVRPRIFTHASFADPGSSLAKTDPAQDLAACAHTCDLLEEARKIALAGGAEFDIVYSPVNQQPPDPRTVPWLKRLNDWAGGHDVKILDLTSSFAAAPASQVYQDQIHLREKGNELAAQAIKNWDVIQAHRQTPPGRESSARP